jgi:hypothetical protein
MGSRFSAPLQTAPGAGPASCTMGSRSLSRGKAAGVWGLPPTPEVYLKSRSGSSWPVLGCVLSLRLQPLCIRRLSRPDCGTAQNISIKPASHPSGNPNSCSANQKFPCNIQHLHARSLLWSQNSATGPHSEPDESS